MHEFIRISLTFIVAIIGWLIAKKIKLPAYALLGPLFLTALLNIQTGLVYMPSIMRPVIQILAGIVIGSRVTKEEINNIKGAYKPIIISVTSTLAYSLFFGMLIYKVTDLNYVTSAFATAPGGAMDMALISMDMGGDPGVVSTMQLVRMLSAIAVFPGVIGMILTKGKKNDVKLDNEVKLPRDVKKRPLSDMLFTLAVGVATGILGYITGLPAMALLASMTGIAVMNVMNGKAYLPDPVRIALQIMAGVLIGQTMTLDSVIALKQLVVPTLIMVVVYLLMTLLIGLLLYKTTDLDFPTAVFACVPGGATDIALICEDFGASSVMVSMIQYPRVFVVLGVYPVLIQMMM